MRVRLLADDRTGAIDTAVRFVPMTGPVLVQWNLADAVRSTRSLAFDLGTRELTGARATSRAVAAAELVRAADLAYLKCDSLLRGWAAEEIAACLRSGHFDHCIIAPAFPAQRRVTRNGRQWAAALDGGDWQQVGPDLAEQLRTYGFPVTTCRPGETAPVGVSLWDAETVDDLRRIVSAARRLPGRILWCGTAGLAEAIAGAPPVRISVIRLPLLALVGTDHPVTARQLAAIGAWHEVLDPDDPAGLGAVGTRLQTAGAVAVTVRVSPDQDRHVTASRIAQAFARVTAGVRQPATLFVTGGETLSGVCAALKADALEIHGEIEPGIPVSTLRGGRWDGVTVISKSGAFGEPELIARLISSAL